MINPTEMIKTSQSPIDIARDILKTKIAPGAIVVGGLAATLGVYHAATSLPGIYRRMKSKKAVLGDPDIAKSQKGLAEQYFNILDTYAPSMAENPLVSKSFVKNLLQYEQIDVGPKLVGDLIAAETARTKGQTPTFEPVKAVAGAIGGVVT